MLLFLLSCLSRHYILLLRKTKLQYLKEKQWNEGSPHGCGLDSVLVCLKCSPSQLKSSLEIPSKPNSKVVQVTVFTGALHPSRNFL